MHLFCSATRHTETTAVEHLGTLVLGVCPCPLGLIALISLSWSTILWEIAISMWPSPPTPVAIRWGYKTDMSVSLVCGGGAEEGTCLVPEELDFACFAFKLHCQIHAVKSQTGYFQSAWAIIGNLCQSCPKNSPTPQTAIIVKLQKPPPSVRADLYLCSF